MRSETPHVLTWTEWDESVHEMTFPTAAAAAKTWRQLSKGAGMAWVSFKIEPVKEDDHVL